MGKVQEANTKMKFIQERGLPLSWNSTSTKIYLN